MAKKVIAVVAIILLIFAALFAGWYVGQGGAPALNAELQTRIPVQVIAAAPSSMHSKLEASGTIEAEDVTITAILGGRVLDVLVDEGDEVDSGAVLVKQDTAKLNAQRKEAEAAIATAKANLASVKAGAREEDIAVAEARVAQAEAAHEMAEQGWRDLVAVRDNQYDLELEIANVESQVEQLTHQITQTKAQIAGLHVDYERYRGDGSAQGKALFESYGKQIQAMQYAISVTLVNIDGARQSLRDLTDIRDNPLNLNASVNEARGRADEAEAAVAVARAALADLKAGATPEAIAVAKAQVRRAQASLKSIEAYEDKMTLRAPMGGIVTSRAIEPGEMAQAGAPLLTVADLDNVTLTVYVPEDRYGRLRLGQDVEVTVDSFPVETFEGKITHIADEAEFTPKNVQTQEERVNTVFAVEIKLPNAEHKLKPGMPADAVMR